MAAKIVILVLQLLAFKNVISYSGPAHDYIFAYIPIEEFALLANAQIEIPALTSSNVMYADGFDIGTALYVDDIVTSYVGGLNSRNSLPKHSSTSCSVCSPSSSNSYQPSSLSGVTILPPVAVPPEVSSRSPLLNSCNTLPLSSSTLQLSSSTLPQSSSTFIDQYSVEETLTEIDYFSSNPNFASYGNSLAGILPFSTGSSRYPTISQPVSVPIYGKRTFSGMVPASGTVSLYGSGY